MNGKLKPLALRKVEKILKQNGWEKVGHKGDHVKFRREGFDTPVGFSAHSEIVVGVIRTIMSQSGKLREEFANA